MFREEGSNCESGGRTITHARPFFSILRIGEKLNVMGPGEAFVDTNLNLLTQECVALDDQELAEEAARATENR